MPKSTRDEGPAAAMGTGAGQPLQMPENSDVSSGEEPLEVGSDADGAGALLPAARCQLWSDCEVMRNSLERVTLSRAAAVKVVAMFERPCQRSNIGVNRDAVQAGARKR